MEHCRLPIELCEAVINALPGCYEFGSPLRSGNQRGYDETKYGQRALCACALTCRAWRVRAQHLLSTFPHIRNDARLAHFTMAIQESPITALTLGEHNGPLDASKASELFMRSCLRLQHFRCIWVRFDRGPPLRLFRMRMPFFASITTLDLWNCSFQSFRGMMDVVWACPDLAMLNISSAKFSVQPSSATGLRQMSAAVGHLRACKKLTILYLDIYTLQASSHTTWGPASAGLSGVGRVFGCAVTELYFERFGPRSHGMLGTLLRDSFPALRSVTVFSRLVIIRPDVENREPPLLHVIAVGRPIPGRLKMIILNTEHNKEHNRCCEEIVSTSEKVVGSEKWLPELLFGLAELTIRLDNCKDPESCARYIWSVLPRMRDVLRFQHRTRWRDAWRPYTLPIAK